VTNQSHVARTYNRIAGVYDLFDAPMDWMGGAQRRRRMLRQAAGRTLEVGVGTGRNFPLYPKGIELLGIDISERMLNRARRRARSLGAKVNLEQADIERLPFADAAFDTVTATCVFCSVENPVLGLEEVRRVVKPGGRVLLLEHVRPRGVFLGWLFDRLTPVTKRLFGPAINRRTEENVRRAGLEITEVRQQGVWREIFARRR
jgi:ubiquinone/menaquinone biosynthesis C-methylase UbiE